MEFLKTMFKSIANQLGKIIAYVLVAIALIFAMRSSKVNALEVSNSYNSLNNDKVDVLINTYKTSSYKYYIITSTIDYNSNLNSNIYYLCLTNDVLTFETNNLVIDSCAELYSYDGGYLLSLEDKSLIIKDSSYFTNLNSNINISIFSTLFVISLSLWIYIFYKIILSFKSKGGGFKYEDI